MFVKLNIILPFRDASSRYPINKTSQKSFAHFAFFISSLIMNSVEFVLNFNFVSFFFRRESKAQMVWKMTVFCVLIKQQVTLLDGFVSTVCMTYKARMQGRTSAGLAYYAERYSHFIRQMDYVVDIAVHQTPISFLS